MPSYIVLLFTAEKWNRNNLTKVISFTIVFETDFKA